MVVREDEGTVVLSRGDTSHCAHGLAEGKGGCLKRQNSPLWWNFGTAALLNAVKAVSNCY